MLDCFEEIRRGSFGFYLGARREGNKGITSLSVTVYGMGWKKGIREGHGEKTSSCSGECMGDVIALLDGGAGCCHFGGYLHTKISYTMT